MRTIILTMCWFERIRHNFVSAHKGEKHTAKEWCDLLFYANGFKCTKVLKFKSAEEEIAYLKAVADCEEIIKESTYYFLVIPSEQITE